MRSTRERRSVAASPRETFRSPSILKKPLSPKRSLIGSRRRTTLAGPSQLLTKQVISPTVMLNHNLVVSLKKTSPGAEVLQPKPGKKDAAKKKGGNKVPSKSPKQRKVSPWHQKASPKKQKASPKKYNPSPKSKTVTSPRKTKATSAKSSPKKSSPPKRSPSPKHSPQQQKSPKRAAQESPVHKYSLRSLPFTPVKPLHVERKVLTARKTGKALSQAEHSVSIVGKKVANKSVSAKKQTKQQDYETPLKPTSRKRKRDMENDGRDEDDILPAQKRKIVKTQNRSVPKKTPKKVAAAFTDIKGKLLTENAVMSKRHLAASPYSSTPVKATEPERRSSMNWNMSGIKNELLARLTKSVGKRSPATPDNSKLRPRNSALSSSKKDGESTRRNSRRQSVKFMINGKMETVRNLKERSNSKRYCYNLWKYLLLAGLPTAVTVGSVLIYTGLV